MTCLSIQALNRKELVERAPSISSCVVLYFSVELADSNRWGKWSWSGEKARLGFCLFYGPVRAGSTDEGKCQTRRAARSLTPFRLKSNKDCLFIIFGNKTFHSAKTKERLIKTGGSHAECPFSPLPSPSSHPSTLPFISSSVIRNVPLYLAEHREYFRLTRNLCRRGWADFRSADLLMCLPHINYWRARRGTFIPAVSVSAGLGPTCHK